MNLWGMMEIDGNGDPHGMKKIRRVRDSLGIIVMLEIIIGEYSKWVLSTD